MMLKELCQLYLKWLYVIVLWRAKKDPLKKMFPTYPSVSSTSSMTRIIFFLWNARVMAELISTQMVTRH
ncbi:uncharacterized protein FPRO_07166 [Fusarium proliferatum ET1]|uniref:Uncharacterized protein n=1 Tax=Fusarium proliferatum (strain ET1) TaxID=1227346 RepID=A0A1L7VA57_FUSPR|nr:uncharacterized protein FPRO_07166 [Fusarium proliferatum ET1]CZR37643.1 uncharacterized protein FPRO_07166 [Fusarium proliferatum ET1]